MSILFMKTCTVFQNSIKCISLGKVLHRKLKRLIPNSSYCTSTNLTSKHDFTTFQDAVERQREQANRSIVVQVQSSQSFKDLFAYCSTIGSVKNMFHYTSGPEPMHFIIVEFENASTIKEVYESGAYMMESQIVPVQSPFLWFKMPARKQPKLKQSNEFKLNVENGTNIHEGTHIYDKLLSAENMSEQIFQLYNLTKLNEVGSRLRFLVAKQIEMALSGMFPNCKALPFGSSVNGCGKMGCDLDLVLVLNQNQIVSDNTRLVFHSKASMGTERSVSQRHMEAFGDIIQLFLPGCSQVRRILQARVPIIKYYQQLADVECDLSMSNVSGVHMSDYLYLMGSIDPRVRPLIFAVRKWAAEVGLTNSSPGRWITNFSLTLLVLSFLQTNLKSGPILPSLNRLVSMAREKDKFVTDEGVNCTFLRDAKQYLKQYPATNTDSLESLLLQFFEYYNCFDFSTKAICLNEGIPITKPEHTALYIVNPLERGLNVSKNVSLEELERFRIELRNAVWNLASMENKNDWGLLSLYSSKQPSRNAFYMGSPNKTKLLQVSKLFEVESEEIKNDVIKKEVKNIKKQTKEQIRKLEQKSNR